MAGDGWWSRRVGEDDLRLIRTSLTPPDHQRNRRHGRIRSVPVGGYNLLPEGLAGESALSRERQSEDARHAPWAVRSPTRASRYYCLFFVPVALPGATTNAFGTPHPPANNSASAGSFTTSCVDGPPSRLRTSQHPSPPLSGGSARKRAKAVASAFVDTTRTTTLPSAHTAVRSATWGFSRWTFPPTRRRGTPWTMRR